MTRKRCPICQKVDAMRADEVTCSLACEAKRRKALGHYQRMQAKARAARLAARRVALAGFGLLTEREQAIYQRGRENALTYSRARQRELGRRNGWAEACGEKAS